MFAHSASSALRHASGTGTKSLTLLQRIVADDGTVRSQSRSVMVAFDFEAQQSVPKC